MKRTLSLLLIAVLILGAISVTASAEDIKIVYLSSTILETPEGQFEQDLIDRFNALDNGITVEVQGTAANDLETKMIALATANELPAFVMGNEIAMQTLFDIDVIVPADDVFDDEYLDGFVDANIDSYSRDGVRVGIPFFGGAQGIIYRKDLMEENGLEEPKTWDEFVTVLQALTKDGNYGITLVGTKNSSGVSRFQPIFRNFGGDEFFKDADGKWQTDIGSDKFIAALRAFTDLDLKHHVVPAGVVETGYPEAVALFASGKAAMIITGSNAIGAITTQVPELKGKLASMPNIAVERGVSTAAGFAFYITTQDPKQQQAAAEFIKYILNPENSIAFSELTGRLPVRKETVNDERVTSMPELQGFLKALEHVYIPPAIPGYGEINDILGEAYQSVFTGMATVEEAAAKAQSRAQAICDAANGN